MSEQVIFAFAASEIFDYYVIKIHVLYFNLPGFVTSLDPAILISGPSGMAGNYRF